MPALKKHFPEAQTVQSLESTILNELKKNDLKASEMIWGTSICSDEVTNIFHHLNEHFAGPGPFRFGGISGLPFTGKTGFRAFASHIPDGGNAFILFGPHIGVSSEGAVGEILREGHESRSTCCGSLIVGLNAVRSGSVPATPQRDDYQQSQVSQLLIEKHGQILNSEEPVKEVTELAYKQIKRELTDIISSCSDALGNAKVLLMGGIVINTDCNEEDYFEVRDVLVIKN